MTESLFGLLAMLVMAYARVPIAVVMTLVGFVGLCLMRSLEASITSATQMVFESAMSYTLSVIPLFVLMGGLVARAGMADRLFGAAYSVSGHRPGGLAITTVLASAGFGAICGSSVATAATLGRISHSSMLQYKYDNGLMSGAIAAGGTLGILIPPSTIMIIYAIMTEVSIGELFAAGVIPGILMAALYCLVVIAWVKLYPEAGPAGKKDAWSKRLLAFSKAWEVLLLMVVVMGGMYGGWFTATEAAGVGCCLAALLGITTGRLRWRQIPRVLIESAVTSAALFAVIVGASIFANFVNYTTLAGDLKEFVLGLGVSATWIVVVICLIYLVLGTVMEELTMILLTIPIFIPVIIALGLDPIWFGVLVVMVVMFGMISPPVGMILFVLKSVLPGIKQSEIFRGVTPFLAAQALMLGVLIAFPAIATTLPKLLFGK